MGFFSSIGKALSGAAKAVGGIAKKAVPTVLSIAKNSIPGAGIVSTGISLLSGKGTASAFTKEIANAVAGVPDPDGYSYGASESVRSGNWVRRKVVIYR